MPPSTASPRTPLLLRLLLQVLRPDLVQIKVHRSIALLCTVPYCYTLWGQAYVRDWQVFVGGTLVMLLLAGFSTGISSYLLEQTHRRYPEPRQAGKRLRITSIGMMLLGVVVTLLALWGFDAVHLFGYHYDPKTGPGIMLSAVLIDLGLVGFFELTFAFSQWQTSQLETEQLARQQLQGQLNAMKQQVNPHFLFNSLSSLSVLIGEDAARAERFVDELAKVYRYLLHTPGPGELAGAAGLTSLAAELRFMHSYAYLLRTRYGPGLELYVPPCEPPLAGTLLPLTLQTLVDNAIRHNALSAARPLRIDIVPGAGHVCVHNTRHQRRVCVPLRRNGLAELRAHYQRLKPATTVQVDASAEKFSVLVPLLAA